MKLVFRILMGHAHDNVVPVTMTWRVLVLRMEETTSRCGW